MGRISRVAYVLSPVEVTPLAGGARFSRLKRHAAAYPPPPGLQLCEVSPCGRDRAPEGRPEGMGGRGILGLSPAQRDGAALFVQSGSSQRSRQGGGRSQSSPPRTCRHSNAEPKSPTSPKASLVAKSPQVCPQGDALVTTKHVRLGRSATAASIQIRRSPFELSSGS